MGYIQVRAMEVSDIAEVAEIERRSFSVPWSDNAFRESLQLSHAIFLVICFGKKIAGYGGMYKVFHEGDIINIAVHPDFRGQGMGRRLLEELEREAVRQEIADITLEVRESNKAAIGLYESLGYIREGIRRDFYNEPKENAIIMWKRGIA